MRNQNNTLLYITIGLTISLLISVFLHNGTATKLNTVNTQLEALQDREATCTKTISDTRKACLGQVLKTQENAQETINGLVNFMNK